MRLFSTILLSYACTSPRVSASVLEIDLAPAQYVSRQEFVLLLRPRLLFLLNYSPHLLCACRAVRDLVDVRRIIASQVADPGMRTQLLRLAGSSPQAWRGCMVADVVAVLTAELAHQQQIQFTSVPVVANSEGESQARPPEMLCDIWFSKLWTATQACVQLRKFSRKPKLHSTAKHI